MDYSLVARRFHEYATETDELEAFGHSLSITTYRYVPAALEGRSDEDEVQTYLNELNQEIQGRMELGGEALVSNAVMGDVYALRMCVVNFRTTLEDVVALARITLELGAAADTELRPEGLR
jgi:aromatic-L-amino-acid decarboxylase